MPKNKLTPAQRAVLKLNIAREMKRNPEYRKKVETRLDELALSQDENSTQEINNTSTNPSYKDIATKLLRWLGVLPGAILGFAFINLIMLGAYNIITITTGESIFLKVIIFDILGNGYAGMIFIGAGYFIAPNFKKEVSIVLTILLVIIMTLSVLSAIYITYDNFSILTALAAIIGATYSCFKSIRAEKIV